MAASIIDTIAQFVSPAVTSTLSARTGEPSSNIDTGLRIAVSTIVGGLAARASDPDAVAQIYAIAIDPNNDTSMLDSSERLVSRVTTGTAWSASSDVIQSLLFGNRESSVVDTLATHAGVSNATARSLLSIATSLVLGYLGKTIRAENLDASALAGRLMAERESVASRLPAGMSRFFPTLGTMGRDRATAEGFSRLATDLRPSAWASLAPVMLVVFSAWALVTFLDRASERHDTRTKREPGAIGTSGLVNRELPSGMNLRFPPNGTEARLLTVIQGSAPVTKNTWFEFDRLKFEPDSAVISADSRDQLTNIAAILEAYPAAQVKIGGYTDNSGDPAANRQLSQARAEAVRNELRRLGVAPSRVQAEGYGEQHPIADNNTAEGRAKNRRVAILVTAK
jgi:outer membrane protein OmpA-like peptidoglycan-associated protein